MTYFTSSVFYFLLFILKSSSLNFLFKLFIHSFNNSQKLCICYCKIWIIFTINHTECILFWVISISSLCKDLTNPLQNFLRSYFKLTLIILEQLIPPCSTSSHTLPFSFFYVLNFTSMGPLYPCMLGSHIQG